MITLSNLKQPMHRWLAGVLFAWLSAHSSQAMAAYEFDSTFGSTGSSGGQFLAPRGVAISQQGKIVITESGNHRVQVCTYLGVCTNFGDFGTLSGEFDRPRGVGVNSVDRLFIADRGNDRIESCAITGSCTDFGGSGVVVGKFESPRGVAIDSQDMIYITDTDHNRVQVCDEEGVCTAFGSFGSNLGQFDSPAGIAIDKAGNVVIADRGNDRIQICSAQGTNCSAFGTNGTATGQFNRPAGVAVDSKDRIIVVDRFNDRVQVCTHLGSCTAFGSFGTTNGKFDLPWGVAVDAQDRIIVADLGNDRIQIFADTAAPAVLITAFSAAPTTIEAGQSTSLSWTVSNATSCSALNGTIAWQAMTPASGGGTTDITIVDAGAFSFRLQCTDGSNTVSADVDVTVTEKPNQVPAQPGTLSASALTTNSATVSWGASIDGDGDMITYQVDYRRNGDLPWISGGSTTATNKALSGLDADQSYDVRVTPNDGFADGDSQTALNLFKTNVLNTAPTQPGMLSAFSVTTYSTTVSWGASIDDQGDAITYHVEYRRNGDTLWADAGSTTGTSRFIGGLNANQSYDVRVTPNDGSVDGSSRTAPNLFKTDVLNTAPGQPGPLSASLLTTDSATVNWGASIDNEGDQVTYRVLYRKNGVVQWTIAGTTTATSQVLTGLDSDQAYDVSVTPNDGSVDGSSRQQLNLFKTEIPNSPPTQPGSLLASAISINSATVSWGASTDSNTDSITYRVEYRRNGSLLWESAGSTFGTSKDLSGLVDDQLYDVRVTPNDGTDDGVGRTTLGLFKSDVDPDRIFRNGFE